MAMACTTLFTFLFDCPAAARSVELLGSWDNFSKPYHLKRDRRRGPGIWSGCYTFDDIICDGDLEKTVSKRDGALIMGGTYWYYYKVDDDEEHHNPTEPSTTVCPLLPGQRLNVLDVPSEGSSRSRSNSESSGIWTRNPNDKYLTPVPPKPLPSPRLGDYCKETYTVPIRTPKSATYPSMERGASVEITRHAKSESTSPNLASGAAFTDFRGLKERFTSKRSAGQSKNVRDLQIGAPTLISTTADDIQLIPLSSMRTPSEPSPMQTAQSTSSLPAPITAKLREFAPLGSHPVNDGEIPTNAPVEGITLKRHLSYNPSMVNAELQSSPGRIRANSADTRRTKHYVFSNEPWLSSPKAHSSFASKEKQNNEDREASSSTPVLQKPLTSSLAPPAPEERPSSSHGGDRSPGLRKSALNKELPPLPHFLVPAPLFTCNSATQSPIAEESPELPQDEECEIPHIGKSRSNFSTWSTESMTYSIPTSDEDGVHSPTFSSLTSNCSDVADHCVHGEQVYEVNRDSAVFEEDGSEGNADHSSNPSCSVSPPQLDLRISTFAPNLLNVDMKRPESTSRRQVSCYGFQGYSLPEDETTSKATITESNLHSEPAIKVERDSSVSHLEKLVNDFGFLGDSVS